MNPTTPVDQGNLQPDADQGTFAAPTTIEQLLADAAKDPARVSDLLDELSRGRLWLPLPDADRPVTDGSAVTLPTVTRHGVEFVPAFTSARELAAWNQSGTSLGRASVPASRRPEEDDSPRSPGDPYAGTPHIVVPAADLARLLPGGLGIALNPGTEASIPIYPDAVGYLAADAIPLVDADGTEIRVGRPPADPVALLTEVRAALGSIPDVREASRAWLSVSGQGEGLVISVTLDDPASEAAQVEVMSAIERAVDAVPGTAFPIDVTFPGEGEPDQVDEWISAHAEPFYVHPAPARWTWEEPSRAERR
jgi:hypothetical protein